MPKRKESAIKIERESRAGYENFEQNISHTSSLQKKLNNATKTCKLKHQERGPRLPPSNQKEILKRVDFLLRKNCM